jgi:CubicO group peptidase (beta-lactamase class C family)
MGMAAQGTEHGLGLHAPESVGMASVPLSRIPSVLQEYIDQGVIPCAQARVFRHGKVVLSQTRGWSSLERQEVLRPDAILRLYPMTKPVVGVAVMMLHQASLLGLQAPFAAYLPEFSRRQVLCGDHLVVAPPPITLHGLLTHTAGLS